MCSLFPLFLGFFLFPSDFKVPKQQHQQPGRNENASDKCHEKCIAGGKVNGEMGKTRVEKDGKAGK